MSRAALEPTTRVDGGVVDRAPRTLDRHDLSTVTWYTWTVEQGRAAPNGLEEESVASEGDGLADVPWMLWALEHPYEAEQAEDWLRTTDPDITGAGDSVTTSAHPGAEPECRPSITPWMLWAIDHPYEAESAEAWLNEVAAGGIPEPAAMDDRSATSVRTRPTASVGRGTPVWLRAMSGTVTAVLAFALVLITLIGYGRLDNRWYHLVTVQGGSMEPTYSIGDVLVLTRPPENVEVGMVLTMQVDGSIVTHRVIKVHDDGTFVTQGDANDYPDDFAGLDVRVVGQVRGALPWVGKYLGGRASTNAWLTDRAVASGSISAATTPPPAPIDAAGSQQAFVESFDEQEPPENDPSADLPSDEPDVGETETKEASVDGVITDNQTTGDAGVTDEPESETTVTSEPVDEASPEQQS